jgi:CRP/FNR family transcriptional regulator, cyclic AMP receptor protein
MNLVGNTVRERFDNSTQGRDNLIDTLQSQTAIMGDRAAAELLADVCELVELPSGTAFIEEGSRGSDVFFILTGSVAIEIQGFVIATREAGSHVGEMAAVDPQAPRSATVRTLEPTVLAKLTEPQLASLAAQFPVIWRRLAVELATRLRQMGRYVRIPHPSPLVFVGSSSEQLHVAEAIQSGISQENATIQLRTEGLFQPSEYTLADLIKIAETADFAVLIVTPDDIDRTENGKAPSTRDNIDFELGLFIGAIGRDRTFLVQPKNGSMALPTDRLGITPISYDVEGDIHSLPARIEPVCTQIKGLMKNVGVK